MFNAYKKAFLLMAFISIMACKDNNNTQSQKLPKTAIKESQKIKVLNVGTFHFGYTSDANKVDFNEEDKKTHKAVRELAALLAQFKPTIVCIENLPEYNKEINQAYQDYLANPSVLNTNYGERSMLAFEVARLSNLKHLHGIDHAMEYNYRIAEELVNSIDSVTYNKYMNDPFKELPELKHQIDNFYGLPLLEQLQLYNQPEYLDFNINVNADMLLYAGTENGFEGADEAAKFYHRNLRIFSNLNRIPMKETDRVFILMGAAHTAFLRENLKRSPKFELVNTLDYLKKD
ncbi:DUF5694 domain-containing protein [Xanthomarina gelatinilytica]|uniref:DUF5694 domain-containing protein n=1 Tax=Xanthomarina gelatinilytica TaxID=1137281 RepID=UPI003AA7BD7E